MLRELKGYQNTNDDLKRPGVVVGYEGKPFNMDDLKPEDFSIRHIARGLSRESRYVGNTHKIYTVGQHATVGAESFLLFGRPDLARIFMLHDASEIILGDMTKPVKNLLKDYEELQEKIDKFIAKTYDIEYPYPPEIKIVDKNSAQYEMTYMMSTKLHTDYWEPWACEEKFIETWNKIEYILKTYYE